MLMNFSNEKNIKIIGIVLPKYSLGLLQHVIAVQKFFNDKFDFQAQLILPEEFKNHFYKETHTQTNIKYFVNFFQLSNFCKHLDYIYIYGPSIQAIPLIKIAKSCNSQVIYHIHEPTLTDLPSFSYIKKVLYSQYIKILLNHSDYIVVSSVYSQEYLLNKYDKFKYKIINSYLPFTDKIKIYHNLEKCFDAIIWGKPSQYKGINRYFELANSMPDYRFAILTTESSYIQNKDLLKKLPNNIVLLIKLCLTDEDINFFVSRSKVCLIPYQRITQSGMIPVALRLGVPVITTDTGSNKEFIQNNLNGLLLPNDDGLIVNRITDISNCIDNYENLYNSSIATFKQIFYYHKSVESLYQVLID